MYDSAQQPVSLHFVHRVPRSVFRAELSIAGLRCLRFGPGRDPVGGEYHGLDEGIWR